MQTDLDTIALQSFGNSPSVASGYLGELGINNMSSARNATAQPNDRLLQFYRETDGPWNPQKRGGRGNSEALPLSFTEYRETNAPSTIGPCTDSGYGSLEKQSVGIPSDYGDVDRSPEGFLSQFTGFQLPTESIHAGLQINDLDHFGRPWNTGALSRRGGIGTDDALKFACRYCGTAFRTQSDQR